MLKIFTIESKPSPELMGLQTNLESLGYQLTHYRSPELIFDDLKKSQPDLILMDTALPAQQSFTTCKAIKSNPDTQCIPVIFVSKNKDNVAVDPKNSFENGASDYISIDLDYNEIVARFESVVRQKRLTYQAYKLAEQLNQMNAELYERNLKVEKELYVTRQLQQSMLPSFLKEEDKQTQFSKCHYKTNSLVISGVYLPCDALGGDIYDVIEFHDKTIGITIADVSGHGVPAGFITAMFKSSFYRVTHNYKKPGDILFHINNELVDMVKTGEYVTAAYCLLEKESESIDHYKMTFSGAGHPYPILYRSDEKRIERLDKNGTPLVWVPDFEYPMGEVTLKPGDKLFLFTDGVSEMRNKAGEMFGENALEEIFLQLIKNQCPKILDNLMTHLSDFAEGRDLDDDLSIVLIEVS